MSGATVVVGNPTARSRTRGAAEHVARAVLGSLGRPDGRLRTVDLADLAPRLFDRSSADVRSEVEAVAGSSLVVVASPTYKASYTGLLKSFLDWFSRTDLVGTVAVPVMVGAGPGHALAVEVHLRPVLVEIGAVVPTRGLYLLEADLADPGPVVDAWLEEAAPALRAASGPVSAAR